jgi:hypothetical protein
MTEEKHSLKEAAGILELKILDLVREVKAGNINCVQENNSVYFTEGMICDFIPSVLLEAETEKEVVPEVKEPEPDPEWLIRARDILSDKIDHYLSQYGEKRVKAVVNNFSSLGDENIVARMIATDKDDSIFKLQNGSFGQYISDLYSLTNHIREMFGDEIPGRYSLERFPEKFLPGNIESLNLELNPLEKEDEPEKDSIDLICEDTGYERDLVEELQEDGYNIYYLDSIIKDGLKLKPSGRAYFNKRYANGEKMFPRIISSLERKGIAHDPQLVDETIKMLGELVTTYKEGDCYRINSQWGSIAEGSIKKYFQKLFDDRKEQNGK